LDTYAPEVCPTEPAAAFTARPDRLIRLTGSGNFWTEKIVVPRRDIESRIEQMKAIPIPFAPPAKAASPGNGARVHNVDDLPAVT